ncbi:MAG: metal-sulfur cluster assembly factor [Verrucomicrobia bacterium]|nr:metal-sulfur cluster assembly factor [Verrucomicrobiota bacterium]
MKPAASQPSRPTSEPATAAPGAATPSASTLEASSPSEATVLAALQQVIDPEIGCNIVDLGLIYGVAITPSKVTVKMTLTTAGCPMHESIANGVQMALLNLEGVDEVEVELVWEPPWNPAMMTEAGRAFVGWHD